MTTPVLWIVLGVPAMLVVPFVAGGLLGVLFTMGVAVPIDQIAPVGRDGET